MKINENTIPIIEKALDFKLYDWQRAYLLGEPHKIPHERATGKTTAYIVKLLLTNKEPIDIKRDAPKYKDHKCSHYTYWFRNEMKYIDDKLTDVGLNTCSVKLKQSTNEIKITMTNPNEPPKIMLNGQVIEGIVKLNYDYETSDYTDSGKHIFSLTYIDKETNTIQFVGQSRM